MPAQGLGLTIDLESLEDVTSRLDRLDAAVVQPAAVQLVTDLGLIGERAAREGMPKDTSEGARSIVSRVSGLEATVSSPLVHVAVMDQGRRAGAPMPPAGALLAWMRRHGFPEEAEYVLRRSIARRGIAGRFFFEKARGKVNDSIPAAVQKFIRAVESGF